MTPTDIVLSWSGGKDSAMALHTLREASHRINHLLTTVNSDYERVSIHGVRRSLLCKQAAAIGVDLVEVMIPAECSHEMYEAKMLAVLTSPPIAGVQSHAFADLFLEDVRAYRERNLATLGKKAIFPVWGRDTAALAREFISLGFRAVVVCVDASILPPHFAGREFDHDLLRALPEHVDPCGENGEFHTFVYDGPTFRCPVPFLVGETVTREGYVFRDLVEP